ncbi:amidohydrolase, partial [Arthrobacter deserti]|nr:amidohydrolase [Arthrobacter deserti]
GGARHTVNLAGRLLAPGFTDAHVHAAMGGDERLGCDLTAAESADAALHLVRTYAAARPGTAWVVGGGWHMHHYPGGTPTAALLDAAVADRPAYLINRDHHGAWVNTRALALAGITAATADPADGRIERGAFGNPTGTLHEGAMDLVSRHLPPAARDDLDAGLRESQRYLHSLGVTGWQEAILGSYSGHADASATYRRLYADGTLTARATGALWVPRTATLDTVADLIDDFRERRRVNAAAGFATVNAKIMVDGVAENGTAAMLEPYERSCDCGAGGSPGTGLTYLPREVLLAVAAGLDAAGFDLHMHAIGDRAVRNGLDAVEHARRANGTRCRPDRRHHLAHIQVVHPDDVPRFGLLGVAANAQALWACNDRQMTDLTLPLLGSERVRWQYPFRSLAAEGAPLIMGSDWPVSTPDPWQAIHVAV